ncbi:ribosomal protein S6 kinase-related protein-like [Paramacrobiotus metropolitanus]|uniref:ribosomal protein S6 kinase-related protein-like n=1 Tax=Paramacrobiotus metropolitanus TaxID=2943436 RepID=UPI002445D4D8|nr:ribosomal protein S6 kinase-related protein-like [Paramacrobiotus metropolitanus]
MGNAETLPAAGRNNRHGWLPKVKPHRHPIHGISSITGVYFSCASHPDLHMATCGNCYKLTLLQRIKNAAKYTVPKLHLRKKRCEDPVSCSEKSSCSLISYRPSSTDSDYGSVSKSFSSSISSSGGSVTSTGSNSSTGSTNFKRRRSRGRCEKRWTNVPNPSAYEYKTVWPVTVKESLFLPEFPINKQPPAARSFEIVKEISRGKFSDVSKICMRNSREEYAMKRMSKDSIIRTHAVNQAKTEAIIQRTSRHPFLVSAVATWQSRTHVYIVTEYFPGGDLAAIWKNFGAFPEAVVQVWGAEIALALDFLHTNGIIYRDLKLGNILVDINGHLKISDFGLARYTTEEPRAMTICGTLNYMAPEVLLGEPYSFAADWWSFGIVLYTLLTGGYPLLSEKDHVVMAEKVLNHSYTVPDGPALCISASAKLLIERLLKKVPSRRLTDFKQISAEAFFCGLSFAQVHRKAICPFTFMHFSNQNHSQDVDQSVNVDQSMDEFDFMDG